MVKWIYCPTCSKQLATDIEGRPTCTEGHFTKYPTPVASTLAFIRNDDEYLLLKRNINPQKGMWDLPGGFVEYDETAFDALIREVEEETQLKNISGDEFLGTFPSDYGDIEKCLTTAYVFESSDRNVVLSEENDDLTWVRLEDITEEMLAFKDEHAALRLLKQQHQIN